MLNPAQIDALKKLVLDAQTGHGAMVSLNPEQIDSLSAVEFVAMNARTLGLLIQLGNTMLQMNGENDIAPTPPMPSRILRPN